jgi:hypothetical protein
MKELIEFRIGNWIKGYTSQNNKTLKYHKITGINHKGIYVKYGNGHTIIKEITPIIFYHHELSLFGLSNKFNLINKDKENKILELEFNFNKVTLWINETKHDGCQSFLLNHIWSLHQLQNLYFDLTNKDLNIKF